MPNLAEGCVAWESRAIAVCERIGYFISGAKYRGQTQGPEFACRLDVFDVTRYAAWQYVSH